MAVNSHHHPYCAQAVYTQYGHGLLDPADYFKRNRGAGVLAADFDHDGEPDFRGMG